MYRYKHKSSIKGLSQEQATHYLILNNVDFNSLSSLYSEMFYILLT